MGQENEKHLKSSEKECGSPAAQDCETIGTSKAHKKIGKAWAKKKTTLTSDVRFDMQQI
ncbi:MAG: hypothetical protein P8184_02675 [Calditrichia bacterium]